MREGPQPHSCGLSSHSSADARFSTHAPSVLARAHACGRSRAPRAGRRAIGGRAHHDHPRGRRAAISVAHEARRFHVSPGADVPTGRRTMGFAVCLLVSDAIGWQHEFPERHRRHDRPRLIARQCAAPGRCARPARAPAPHAAAALQAGAAFAPAAYPTPRPPCPLPHAATLVLRFALPACRAPHCLPGVPVRTRGAPSSCHRSRSAGAQRAKLQGCALYAVNRLLCARQVSSLGSDKQGVKVALARASAPAPHASTQTGTRRRTQSPKCARTHARTRTHARAGR